MAQSATAVSLEQYLSTGYTPDVEYLSGELKEKPVVSPVHGRVQVLLALWFGQHEEEWGVQTLVESRTQVSEHAVRLPDVTVVASGPLPRKALVDPPLLAIEVLSETDTYADLRARARDLKQMGVNTIWLIDPETRSVERWLDEGWHPVRENRVLVEGSPAYLDLDWLWTKLGPQG